MSALPSQAFSLYKHTSRKPYTTSVALTATSVNCSRSALYASACEVLVKIASDSKVVLAIRWHVKVS